MKTGPAVQAPVFLLTMIMFSMVLADSTDPAIDLERLLDRARLIQNDDLAGWHLMSFTRHVTREKLNASREVIDSEELEFRITPVHDGFDEELVSIDGKEPSRREVRKHSKEKRFSKRYRTAVTGDNPDYTEAEYSLAALLRRDDLVYEGLESRDGRFLHRLAFDTLPEDSASDTGGKFWAATAGKIWLEAEGLHIARAETWMERPVSAGFGLARIYQVKTTLEAGAAGSHWLPFSIEVRTHLSIAGKQIRKRNRFRYTEYVRIR